MSGNKTLYTTAKCRSMTTKTEFVDMWNDPSFERSWRIISLFNDDVIYANDFILFDDYVVLRKNNATIAAIHYNIIKKID